jgi:surface carbohydrate biosynthesis protein
MRSDEPEHDRRGGSRVTPPKRVGAPPRVCLVVDHPARDLDGLTLLGVELANRSIEVFLVPMYEMNEVFSLAPDLVLVNYVRFANARFVRACRAVGIAVGVLDTEGGVRQDMEEYARQVAAYTKHVQLYCVWGRAQYDALDRGAGLMRGALHATGCPRYDWTAEPWRDSIARPANLADPMILVNTNFPVARPRFQSRDREIADLMGMGYDRQAILDVIQQAEHARSEVIRATATLAREFPAATIILRPHPFEDRRTFEEELAAHSNVRVEQSGPVFQWIRHARLVVHFNCSTAIDSMLLGVEAVHLNWIDAPLLTQPVAAAVSHRVDSMNELVALAARALKAEPIPVPPELAATRRSVIEQYFFEGDGRSSVRVADAIVDLLSRIRPRSSSGLRYTAHVFRALGRGSAGAGGSLGAAAKYGIAAIGGAAVFDGLRRRLGKRGPVEAKAFSVADVAAIVRRLDSVKGHRSVDVGVAGWANSTMPHLTGMRSIRLTPVAVEQRAAG